MEIDINIATEELRQQLVKEVNDSKLPISTLYLIINELQWKVERAYYAALNAPAQEVIKNSGEEISTLNVESNSTSSTESERESK